MRQRYVTEQWLPFPRELVFSFFANPANLALLMPAWQQARIDEVTLIPPPSPHPTGTSVLPGVFAGDGTRLLITARAAPGLPLRISWEALIQDFRWNTGFCDVQLKGPFASWRHCHSLRSDRRQGKNGTIVRDEVQYELPLGAISWIAAPLGHAAMKGMFGHRQKRAAELMRHYAATL